MNDQPNKVVQSSRQIIEHKLLAALEDDETVAIIATKADLDVLIFSLSMAAADGRDEKVLHRNWRAPHEAARELRARFWKDSMEQLRREAFGE